ncbi:hypothetical protein, partial [Pseudomonas sp. A-R-26]|uniref:hypothetical protein n=1 Tax=Pseudomonas sp. A-R-26 TaxID=2832404 RepID=UPI001CBCE6F0
RGLIAWDFHVSPDLNPSNRPVRTRMPGGVAGVRSMKAVPYADLPGGSLSFFVALVTSKAPAVCSGHSAI